ncbi:hypothetical protein CRE_00404 [Caenorhabditis remanei]|uniref:Lin-15A/B-like domain-containing protein n=1 Tax=Caenorhabditis remanei TaxID=31234 RepID=E3LCD9_CAERE|nr:hypothetical protein CRE_00404 [Caenorhabditis remanei]
MGDQKHDHGMLTHLLVDFIRDIGLNFSAFDNLKFHEFVKYLNPKVKLPTSAEMTLFYEKITEWDNRVLVMVRNDGDRNSQEYLLADDANDKVYYQSHEYSDTEAHVLQDSMEMCSNEMSMQMQNMKYTDQNHGLDYGAAFENGNFSSEQLQMSEEPLAINNENHQEEKCSLISWEHPSIGSTYAGLNNIMPEAQSPGSVVSDEYEFNQQESSPDSSPMGQESPSFQDSDFYASTSLVPALHCESLGKIEIKQENQANLPYPKYFLGCKVLKIEKNIVTLKSIPGYLNKPCIVCCERKEGRHMREVKGSYNAYIMIFACIKNGYYLKEKGKQISRLHTFYSCICHNNEMVSFTRVMTMQNNSFQYNSACKHMGIANPSTDIHAKNKKIVDAFSLIKEIKSGRETIKRNNNLGTFIGLVKMFCVTYKRNYDCLIPMLVATKVASYEAEEANNIFVVTPENCAKQAVRIIGTTWEITTGCVQHDIQVALGTLFSFWFFKVMFVPVVMLGVHKHRVASYQAKNSKKSE